MPKAHTDWLTALAHPQQLYLKTHPKAPSRYRGLAFFIFRNLLKLRLANFSK
jgi:hypothetical protein